MINILYNGVELCRIEDNSQIFPNDLKKQIANQIGVCSRDFYLIHNGRKYATPISNGAIYVVPRIIGGKGGFGSMLRAIGAQIEKTTNREACRDLSGRRLRDINEEQRLKNWITQQVEREKEAAARKQKKLERLCEEPKFEFKDENYDKERSELPEKVEDAVLQGLSASSSSSQTGVKRKLDDKGKKKKKPKLWVDADLEDSFSSSGSCSEDDESSCVKAAI